MAGRPFGAFDVPPIRSEANVDPFNTFVNNGMRPVAGAQGTPATNLTPAQNAGTATAGLETAPTSIMPILQMLGPFLARMQSGRPTGARVTLPSQPAPTPQNWSGGPGIVGAGPTPTGTAPGIDPLTTGGNVNQLMPLLQTMMSIFGNLGGAGGINGNFGV